LPGALLPRFTLALVRHFTRCGDRAVRTRTRLWYLIESLGLDGYREAVLQEFAQLAGEAARAAVLPHDGTHLVCRPPRDICGVHAQKQPGLHWVGLNVPMGRLDGEGMLALADLAQRYGTGELRFSESQNVLIASVPDDQLESLCLELDQPALRQCFRLDPGPLMAEAVSCTGNRYCSFALIPTKTTAQQVVEELEARLSLPHGIRLHWTGCPNACGQPYMGQIGLMGAKARQDGRMVEAAKIYLGGSMGPEPKLAELHHKGVPLNALVDELEVLLVEHHGARRRAIASAGPSSGPS
jgi:ferredoxin-nitrite reductase